MRVAQGEAKAVCLRLEPEVGAGASGSRGPQAVCLTLEGGGWCEVAECGSNNMAKAGAMGGGWCNADGQRMEIAFVKGTGKMVDRLYRIKNKA